MRLAGFRGAPAAELLTPVSDAPEKVARRVTERRPGPGHWAPSADGGNRCRAACGCGSARALGTPLARPPALRDEGLCAVHDDRKPAMCRAVPLDPTLPDGLQRVVLTRRRAEAALIGTDCLRSGDADEWSKPLIEGDQIVDPACRGAAMRVRRDLGDVVQGWGRGVFAVLASELDRQHAIRAQLAAGKLTLRLSPVLVALEEERAAERGRDRRHAEAPIAQIALIDASIASAIQGRRPGDRVHANERHRLRARDGDDLAAA